MAYNRIIARIEIIEEKLSDLEQWLPLSLNQYMEDKKGQAAIERTIQIIMQAIIDISIQFLKLFKLEIPQSEMDIVDLLQPYIQNIEIIKELKKFRNFIVHIYGKIDQQKIFTYATQMKKDIPKLVEEFKQIIEKRIL